MNKKFPLAVVLWLLALSASPQTQLLNVSQATDPFSFAPAPSGRIFRRQTFWPQTISPGHSFDIFNRSGSGVVREMKFTFGQQDADANEPDLDFTKRLLMKIWVDGESSPSTVIPLCHLVGWLAPPNLATNLYQTPWFKVMDNWLNTPTGPAAAFIIRYQIPWGTGIRIALSDDGSEPNFQMQFFAEVAYQDFLPDGPNSRLRFMATNVVSTNTGWNAGAGTVQRSGTNIIGSGTSFNSTLLGKYLNDASLGAWDAQITSVTDATHLGIAANDTNDVAAGASYGIADKFTFFSRPPGSAGYVAAVYGNIGCSASQLNYFEANTRFSVNGESEASLEWGATEEFFMGDFYFGNVYGPNAVFQNDLGGVTANSATGNGSLVPRTRNVFCGYRLFAGTPIGFGNGIKGEEPVNVLNTATRMTNNWTTVWYEFR
jgi:hypothetical protein